MTSRPLIQILLIEDDDVDILAIRRAFDRRGVANPIVVAHDGDQALSILRGNGESPPLSQPYLVLLDLNMPRTDGFEFLDALRGDPDLRGTIVFILTTSEDDRDIASAYDRQVAGYASKQGGAEVLTKLVRLVELYQDTVFFPVARFTRS